jgi:hypothetical protein
VNHPPTRVQLSESAALVLEEGIYSAPNPNLSIGAIFSGNLTGPANKEVKQIRVVAIVKFIL